MKNKLIRARLLEFARKRGKYKNGFWVFSK